MQSKGFTSKVTEKISLPVRVYMYLYLALSFQVQARLSMKSNAV